jgi:ankyrin repeat protein
LLLFNADINIKKHDGSTILHDAMRFSELNTLIYLLNIEIFDEKKKLKLNLRDNLGNTPLFTGIVEGRYDHVKILLDIKDVNVNIRNEKDLNIFHVACQYGRDNIIELLYSNIKTKDLFEEKNKIGQTPLHIASKSNSLSCLLKLLQLGANINTQDNNGNTPLHLAIEKKNLSCVKNLILSGAKINLQNKKKISPKKLIQIHKIVDLIK